MEMRRILETEPAGINHQIMWSNYTFPVSYTHLDVYKRQIMKGAAALNNHRLVFDLYRRWERFHVRWENRYLAGVAAFNIGRYDRAASLWGSITEAGRFSHDLQELAYLVESDLVPPFTFEYVPPDPAKLLDRQIEGEVQIASDIQNGITRAAALAYLFSSEIEKKSAEGLLSVLIQHLSLIHI